MGSAIHRKGWNALLSVPPEEVKVIICGQDPYHGSGQAHGLAFSVMQGQAHPPSLRNVLKELANDLEPNAEPKGHGSAVGALQHWSDQGVLLLNDVLTVSEGRPGSHQGIGWEQVTQAILEVVLMQNTPLVLMLWGASARKKNAQLRGGDYLILETSHPSPLSAYRGFLGSKPFSRANAWLESRGLSSIQW